MFPGEIRVIGNESLLLESRSPCGLSPCGLSPGRQPQGPLRGLPPLSSAGHRLSWIRSGREDGLFCFLGSFYKLVPFLPDQTEVGLARTRPPLVR